MLPHIRDPPVSMQRFNGGIERPGFFQKDIPKGAPEWVPTIEEPKKGGTVRHVLANEVATLVWLGNQNCITPHVSTARADRLDRPPGPCAWTARIGSCGISTRRATTSTSCAARRSTSAP